MDVPAQTDALLAQTQLSSRKWMEVIIWGVTCQKMFKDHCHYDILSRVLAHKGNSKQKYIFFFVLFFKNLPDASSLGSKRLLLSGCSTFLVCSCTPTVFFIRYMQRLWCCFPSDLRFQFLWSGCAAWTRLTVWFQHEPRHSVMLSFAQHNGRL